MVAELEDTMDMQVIRFPENLSLDEDDRLILEILEIIPRSDVSGRCGFRTLTNHGTMNGGLRG